MGDLQSMQQDEPQLVRLLSTSPATYCLQNASGHVPPIHLHHYLGQTLWKCEVIYSRHFPFLFIFHAHKFLHFLFIFFSIFYL